MNKQVIKSSINAYKMSSLISLLNVVSAIGNGIGYVAAKIGSTLNSAENGADSIKNYRSTRDAEMAKQEFDKRREDITKTSDQIKQKYSSHLTPKS